MTYFECTECGQMAELSVFDRSLLRQECPVCERETVWESAFEVEGGAPF